MLLTSGRGWHFISCSICASRSFHGFSVAPSRMAGGLPGPAGALWGPEAGKPCPFAQLGVRLASQGALWSLLASGEPARRQAMLHSSGRPHTPVVLRQAFWGPPGPL